MYSVKFYSGNYSDRQQMANNDNAIVYVEQHFNSAVDPNTNYSLVVVGDNASSTSIDLATWMAGEYSSRLKIGRYGNTGVSIGGIHGRGNSNIKYTRMPAVLLEPLFCSSYDGSDFLRSEHGRQVLAAVIVEGIQKMFPEGGLVAFSVGHKGKLSNPHDRGALVLGGGFEADYAEAVLSEAAGMLVGERFNVDLIANEPGYVERLRKAGSGPVDNEKPTDQELAELDREVNRAIYLQQKIKTSETELLACLQTIQKIMVRMAAQQI